MVGTFHKVRKEKKHRVNEGKIPDTFERSSLYVRQTEWRVYNSFDRKKKG